MRSARQVANPRRVYSLELNGFDHVVAIAHIVDTTVAFSAWIDTFLDLFDVAAPAFFAPIRRVSRGGLSESTLQMTEALVPTPFHRLRSMEEMEEPVVHEPTNSCATNNLIANGRLGLGLVDFDF